MAKVFRKVTISSLTAAKENVLKLFPGESLTGRVFFDSDVHTWLWLEVWSTEKLIIGNKTIATAKSLPDSNFALQSIWVLENTGFIVEGLYNLWGNDFEKKIEGDSALAIYHPDIVAATTIYIEVND